MPEVIRPNVDIAENKERSYGSFRRVISLPVDVNMDSISAKLKNGVLDVEIEKMDAAKEGKSKRIEIKGAA